MQRNRKSFLTISKQNCQQHKVYIWKVFEKCMFKHIIYRIYITKVFNYFFHESWYKFCYFCVYSHLYHAVPIFFSPSIHVHYYGKRCPPHKFFQKSTLKKVRWKDCVEPFRTNIESGRRRRDFTCCTISSGSLTHRMPKTTDFFLIYFCRDVSIRPTHSPDLEPRATVMICAALGDLYIARPCICKIRSIKFPVSDTMKSKRVYSF